MPDVSLLHWPADRERRTELAAAGRPRILLVDADHEPPEVEDLVEDWIRLPASEADVRCRVRTVEKRFLAQAPPGPSVDENGVLRVGDMLLALPPIEARLASVLVERLGAVVSRDQLTRAGWPQGVSDRNLLDVRIVRLRRRLAAVGLTLTTVRHRGYLLELSGERQVPDTKR